ncbi:hypothetical protein NGG16_04045 [Enterococcus casseliflavus]|uniref:hypothetical protein n=1 Tax=Enterococcus casseliflavus TaxID=37734 RepID=UPI002DBE78C2|nr:hypothetical protein [Enterococcus casseliflavus]MEB8416609.1 hypothetical protein [Enterococcus casseliflavus]
MDSESWLPSSETDDTASDDQSEQEWQPETQESNQINDASNQEAPENEADEFSQLPSALENDEPEKVETTDSREELEDSEEPELFSENQAVLSLTIENQEHLRAVLLGEVYTLVNGSSQNYGSISDDTHLVLTFFQSLQLTEPISGIARKVITFAGGSEGITFSQAAPQNNIENTMTFLDAQRLTFENLTFSNIMSAGGLVQTQGSVNLWFTNVNFVSSNATGRFSSNNQATITFTGNNRLTTGTTGIPVFFTANRITINDHFHATIAGSGSNPLFEANQVAFAEEADFRLEKSNNANTGAGVRLTGSGPMMTLEQASHVHVRQTGMFVTVTNTTQDSIVRLENGAHFDGGLGQGFSGNTTATIGELHLASRSKLTFSEFGTVAAFPAINVGRLFKTEAASSKEQGVIIEGSRSGGTTGAFIHLRSANSIAELGSYTKTRIQQQGPMFTGVATSTITIGDHAVIDNTHSFGFNGNTNINAIDIGNHVSLSIQEPTNAATSSYYNTFFARSRFTVGEHSSIVVPRRRTINTSALNAVIRLNVTGGRVVFGKHSTLEANHRGALIHAQLGEVVFEENSRVEAVLSRGVTNGFAVRNFTMKQGAEMVISEHTANQQAVARFNVQSTFLMERGAKLTSTRSSTGTQGMVQFAAANARFVTEEEAQIHLTQRGALVVGNTSSNAFIGARSELTLNTTSGFTGNTMMRRLDVGPGAKINVTEPSTNALNLQYFTFTTEILIREEAEVTVTRTSNVNGPAFRLTGSGSRFTTLEGSKLSVNQLGMALRGVTTTDVSLGKRSINTIQTGWGFTANYTIRSFVLEDQGTYRYTQPTSGSTAPAVGTNYASIRVAQRFVLGEEAAFQATRARTTVDSRFILLNSANSTVFLGKNSTFDISQSGGIFQVQTTSTLTLDEGAKLNVLTERGLNTANGGAGGSNLTNAFGTINVGKNAEFIVRDGYQNQRTTAEFTNRPLVNVGRTFNVGEDATVLIETTINKSLSSAVLFFRQANAQLNLSNVKSFELAHPSAVSGGSNGNLQRLIRSQANFLANGLRINVTHQKLTLWQGANQTATSPPTEEFINLSGVFRINRNNGTNANGLPAGVWSGTMNAVSQAFLMTAESVTGSVTSTGNQTPIETAIARNNFSRLRFSEPEGLMARIDPLSDQSTEITGFMYEDAQSRITYENTEGETVIITNETVTESGERMIQWGDYRDENRIYRYFTIKLAENERLETGSKLNVFLTKPDHDFYIDIDVEVTVIQGIEYQAFNITLDRQTINQLATEEELHKLIIKESDASARDVLSNADLTEEIRLAETNLTTDVTEDGTYFAVLEVGSKTYEFTVGIDVTSSLDQLSVRIPTRMLFESMYDSQESNRDFTSPEYEIRNNSYVGVAVKVNRLIVEDSAGIVLLKEGEDPLDYAEPDPESEEDPILTEEDISQPLLALNVMTEQATVRLYDQMPEADLVSMPARNQSALTLGGTFYGNYPLWIVDSEYEEGGYYEDNLRPQYRFVLRFVPK